MSRLVKRSAREGDLSLAIRLIEALLNSMSGGPGTGSETFKVAPRDEWKLGMVALSLRRALLQMSDGATDVHEALIVAAVFVERLRYSAYADSNGLEELAKAAASRSGFRRQLAEALASQESDLFIGNLCTGIFRLRDRAEDLDIGLALARSASSPAIRQGASRSPNGSVAHGKLKTPARHRHPAVRSR